MGKTNPGDLTDRSTAVRYQYRGACGRNQGPGNKNPVGIPAGTRLAETASGNRNTGPARTDRRRPGKTRGSV